MSRRSAAPPPQPSPTRENWTRDQDGEIVNWTEPPYYVNGVLDLHLAHEDGFLREDVLRKRLYEYMAIWRNRFAKAKQDRRRHAIENPTPWPRSRPR